jgi:hypothetical protein
MPLIRVVYRAGEYAFDYVTSDLLDSLITQDEISHFYRPSESRWIDIRIDPVRGSGAGTKDQSAGERIKRLGRLEKDA